MTNYQKYQLQWMIDHDHPLDELISEMLAMQTDGDKIVFDGDVADLFTEWEYTNGFGGEIWACENEWKQCEAKAEPPKTTMDHSERMEFFGCMADIVEDWLESKGITADDIPCEDRDQAIADGEAAEDCAIIYGEDYDHLTGEFEELLINCGLIEKEEH